MSTFERVDGLIVNINDIPAGTTFDQVPHQLLQVAESTYDPDAQSEEEKNQEKLFLEAKKSVNIDNLLADVNTNAKKAVYNLLALQDNSHPLKKGGIGIAYRADALLNRYRNDFNDTEDAVFSCITGLISSLPENETYKIYPRLYKEKLGYKGGTSVYKIFKNAAESLRNKSLKFTYKDFDNDVHDTFEFNWCIACHYHDAKNKEDDAYIEFVPTPLIKALCLSSTLAHGAHYDISVHGNLKGRAKSMYIFLESKKRTTLYPGAQPGKFEMSLDEVKFIFDVPASYKPSNITQRFFKETKEAIDNWENSEIVFTYKEIKAKGMIRGYSIEVHERAKRIKSEVTALPEKTDEQKQIESMIAITGVELTEEEKEQIYKVSKKYNREMSYMLQAIGVLQARISNQKLDKLVSPFKYMIALIVSGNLSNPAEMEKAIPKVSKSTWDLKNKQDYDMKELEKKLRELQAGE